MRRASLRVIALTVASFLLIGHSAPAQEIQKVKPETDPYIKEIINSRRPERWDFTETQLLLTLPPYSRPVQLLPEWAPTGAVMFTLDFRFLASLMANVMAGTELKEIEVKRRDLKLANSEMFLAVKDHYRLNDEELFELLEFSHVFLHILKDLANHAPLVILLPSESIEESYLHFTVDYIKRFPGGVELLNSPNTKFIQIPVNTMWLRDYGPIFVRDANKQIICVDTRYHTSRESKEEKQSREREELLIEALNKILSSQLPNAKEKESGKHKKKDIEGRLLDDISPSLLASRLRQQEGNFLSAYPISVVRPPLALDGGDFMTDGLGNGFTSTYTLMLNGGSIDSVNLIFKEYFGINNMLYLQPLPGSTVKHIDMFFKVVSPEIILIGKFETRGNSLTSPLQVEAQKTLDYNLHLLKSFYQMKGREVNVISSGFTEIQKGKVNIVCVPMPDLSRPVLEKIKKLEGEIESLRRTIQEQAGPIVELLTELEITLTKLRDLSKKLDLTGEDIESASGRAAIDLQQIAENASRVKDLINDLKQGYEEKLGIGDWDALFSKVNKITKYIDKKTEASKRDLSEKDARALASHVQGLLDIIKLLDDRANSYAESITEKFESGGPSLFKQKSQEKKDLEEEQANGADIYRTFLNSLFIKTQNAKLLLVPVYAGLDSMQRQVQEIFRKVYSSQYGDIIIIPVDSDNLIQMSGTIHCITKTIPNDIHVLSDDWDYKSKLRKK